MDVNKQPGIKVEGMILAESYFKRTPTVPKPISISIKIDVSNKIDNEKNQLITEMTVTLNRENDPVYGKFVYIGIFSASKEQNMSLIQFGETNAPAFIFPYIREEIQSRSVKAALPPIIIQPLNFVALNSCDQG